MPRVLTDDFFNTTGSVLDTSDSILMESQPTLEKGAGLEAVSGFLSERSEKFQRMTQRKGAPMTYGGKKVDNRG